ncbi:MAG: family 1 glycosylhydrolase [Chloroflexi bacterium]|nr:family 1 glycosylhydrolase [Chloroflexota bacterium]
MTFAQVTFRSSPARAEPRPGLEHHTAQHWRDVILNKLRRLPGKGIFLTGIEASDPVVGGIRRNQLREARDFTLYGRERLENIRALGIRWLRFGPPYSQVHLGPGSYDWELWDTVVQNCAELGIHILADLVHFGLPDWLHADTPHQPYWQNPSMPSHVAAYAAALARRYPSLRYFTPINEPFVTAWFSARLGLWNEQIARPWTDDRAFVCAAANAARACILARQAIRRVWQTQNRPGSPVFLQNESFETAIAVPGAKREEEVRRFNLARFVALDLAFGHRDSELHDYVLGEGLSAEAYEWFMRAGSTDDTLLGIDHYPGCVHTYGADEITHDGPSSASQLVPLVVTYAQRYAMQDRLLHTESNGLPNCAAAICERTYHELAMLRRMGYAVWGMGWYGDEVQVGWQSQLSGPDGHAEYPVGLFRHGQPQPVAGVFRRLARRGLPPIATAPALRSDTAAA